MRPWPRGVRDTTATVTTIVAGTSTTPFTWATQFGTSAADGGYAITSDASGDTTLAGYTNGALPGCTNAGWGDVVVATYAP